METPDVDEKLSSKATSLTSDVSDAPETQLISGKLFLWWNVLLSVHSCNNVSDYEGRDKFYFIINIEMYRMNLKFV